MVRFTKPRNVDHCFLSFETSPWKSFHSHKLSVVKEQLGATEGKLEGPRDKDEPGDGPGEGPGDGPSEGPRDGLGEGPGEGLDEGSGDGADEGTRVGPDEGP